MWRSFISALQFLTILPFRQSGAFNARETLPFFPLVGLFLGALLMMVDSVAMALWTPAVASIVDLIALVILTGALHVDGLADTADGLYGRRTPEQALHIMKDSRIGAIGMVAVVCCLAVKWGGLYGLDHHRGLSLALVPAYARAAVLFGMRFLPYGRPEGGTGQAFFDRSLGIKDFWGCAPLLCLSFFLGLTMLTINLCFAAIVTLLIVGYRRRIGCITGDMLGAMIEITEACLFLIISAGAAS
jgi:adenosylcobinamide-GDP ribazoletransferase